MYNVVEKMMFVLCPGLFLQVFTIGAGDRLGWVMWVFAKPSGGRAESKENPRLPPSPHHRRCTPDPSPSETSPAPPDSYSGTARGIRARYVVPARHGPILRTKSGRAPAIPALARSQASASRRAEAAASSTGASPLRRPQRETAESPQSPAVQSKTISVS